MHVQGRSGMVGAVNAAAPGGARMVPDGQLPMGANNITMQQMSPMAHQQQNTQMQNPALQQVQSMQQQQQPQQQQSQQQPQQQQQNFASPLNMNQQIGGQNQPRPAMFQQNMMQRPPQQQTMAPQNQPQMTNQQLLALQRAMMAAAQGHGQTMANQGGQQQGNVQTTNQQPQLPLNLLQSLNAAGINVTQAGLSPQQLQMVFARQLAFHQQQQQQQNGMNQQQSSQPNPVNVLMGQNIPNNVQNMAAVQQNAAFAQRQSMPGTVTPMHSAAFPNQAAMAQSSMPQASAAMLASNLTAAQQMPAQQTSQPPLQQQQQPGVRTPTQNVNLAQTKAQITPSPQNILMQQLRQQQLQHQQQQQQQQTQEAAVRPQQPQATQQQQVPSAQQQQQQQQPQSQQQQQRPPLSNVTMVPNTAAAAQGLPAQQPQQQVPTGMMPQANALTLQQATEIIRQLDETIRNNRGMYEIAGNR